MSSIMNTLALRGQTAGMNVYRTSNAIASRRGHATRAPSQFEHRSQAAGFPPDAPPEFLTEVQVQNANERQLGGDINASTVAAGGGAVFFALQADYLDHFARWQQWYTEGTTDVFPNDVRNLADDLAALEQFEAQYGALRQRLLNAGGATTAPAPPAPPGQQIVDAVKAAGATVTKAAVALAAIVTIGLGIAAWNAARSRRRR